MIFQIHRFVNKQRQKLGFVPLVVILGGLGFITAVDGLPVGAYEPMASENQLDQGEAQPMMHVQSSPAYPSTEPSSSGTLNNPPPTAEVSDAETPQAQADSSTPPPPEVSRWVRELRSPLLWQRHQAMQRLIQVGPPAVKPLVECLNDADWRVRESAVLVLGEIGHPKAVRPLVDRLADPAWQVRRSAVKALGMFQEQAPVEVLTQCLREDRDWSVRQAAAEALGEIGDPRAIEGLMAAIRDSRREVRLAAVTALGGLGDPRVLETLLACLDSGDWELQKRAAAGLARLGQQAVAPLVERFQGADSDRQRLAGWALVQIGAPAATPLAACLEDSDLQRRKAAAELLVQIGQPAVEPLSQRLGHPEATVRQLVAQTLEELGWRPAVGRQTADFYLAKQDWDALVGLGEAALDSLTSRKNDQAPFIRAKVAETLGKIGSPKAFDPLVEMLKDTDAQVRWHAANALANLADPRAFDPLAACLKDEDPDLRALGLKGLARLKDPRAVPLVIGLLADPEPNVARTAIESLGNLADPRAVEPLLALVDSPELGLAAIQALGRIRHPQVLQPLLSRLHQVPAYKQAAILEALAELNKPEVAEEAFRIFQNPDAPLYLRRTAAICLGKLGDRRALPTLVQYAIEAESPFRERAIEALRPLAQEAIPQLLAHLKSPNEQLRKNAASALVRLGYKPERIHEEVDLYLAAEEWTKIQAMGEAAVGPLAARLRYPHRQVRQQIAALLEQMGYQPVTPRAVVDLALASGKPARYQEVRRLEGAAVEPLLAWLRAADTATRTQAAQLLTDLGYSPQTEIEQAWWALATKDWATLEKLGPIAADPLALLLNEEDEQVLQKAVDLLVKLADPRAAPFLARRMPNWRQRHQLCQQLQRLGWQPQTDAEQVYWRVAAHDWDWLDDHWETTKRILLDDLRSAEFRRIEHAAYALITIGREEIIPDLIQALEKHGTKEMAETFANSGQVRLREAAERWVAQRGAYFSPGPGAHEAFWPHKVGIEIPGVGSSSEKSQAPSPESSDGFGSQSPSPPDTPTQPQSQESTFQHNDPTLQLSQTRVNPLHTQQQTEMALWQLQQRHITREPIEDLAKQHPFGDPAMQSPLFDPARERPLLDPARQKPLIEPWRQVPDPARLPGMAPPVRLPPDPGRLAPLPRMSVPSFGPSFGPRF